VRKSLSKCENYLTEMTGITLYLVKEKSLQKCEICLIEFLAYNLTTCQVKAFGNAKITDKIQPVKRFKNAKFA
jgi:hypothetical protein